MAADTAEQDPFRLLPEELLRHVLSFLPDEDALQTCVLDTRWRDLWRRATSLYFDFHDCEFSVARSERFERIMNLMMDVRGDTPLAKCGISSFPDYIDCEELIGYALMCQAKELIVRSHHTDEDPIRYDTPLIAQHLKTIEFYNLNFQGPAVDFSNCPVLEDLKMGRCRIQAPSISSRTLKRLCITRSCAFPMQFHIRIVAPGLMELQLDDFQGLTPSFGYMPLLVTAYVGVGNYCHDFCVRNGQGCTKYDCGCHFYPADQGVLLNGLSNAVNLELTIKTEAIFQFIYRWDLRRCPVFAKLKTLLLNEWFRAIDLVCILQHSPVLEMLTLKLDNTKNLIGATGAQEQSFVCAHLKVVNIEVKEVDEGVCKLVEILRTCSILRDHITIKAPSLPSYYFSFQKVPTWEGASFY